MDELIYRIALSMLRITPQVQKQLLDVAGSATALYTHRNNIRDICPEASPLLINIIRRYDDKIDAAKRELDYDLAHNIRVITCADAEYPQRLLNTAEPPTVLYCIGNADLNARHNIAIVGTRHCTAYGVDMCNQFIADLHEMVPDIQVFSGLAYGIDITAHRKCLALDIPNVAVMAHGLEQVYPTAHRHEANKICQNGALLTEYPVYTAINQKSFIARNRIVAGCCDATLVVESKEAGGSLHTANYAFDYQREIYTFPGRITDVQSLGCIDLVYNNIATLIRSAEQFVKAQGWETVAERRQPVQTELFMSFDETEMAIIKTLCASDDTMHIDVLAKKTCIPMAQLRSKLLSLEMQDVIEVCPGFRYRVTNRYRVS